MRKSATQSIIETTTWNKDLEKGATLEGVYIRKEVFNGKFGTTEKYIVDFNGTMYGVYSSASLLRQFKNVPEGSYVWIEYKGEEVSKNGRPVKVYSVDYDDEYQQ